jgi:hypothetical protein
VPNPCWAECLGDCSDEISHEHVVSRALFEGDQVTVRGFPWCKDPIKIRLPRLTAKILCKYHNNSLSSLDAEGAKAFATMREMTRLSNVRAALPPRAWRIARHHINGPLLERWFLKTLINLTFDREYRVGSDSERAGWPSNRLVEIAFGKAQFTEQAGLSCVVHVGQQIKSDDTVVVSPLIQNTTYVCGGLFVLRGIRYFLSLDPPGLARLPNGVIVNGEDWGLSQLNFHNRELRNMVGKHLSQVIHSDW